MNFCTFIAMKLFFGSLLLGDSLARPLENEDYRQYQNAAGNSYTPPLLSPGVFGSSQSGFSSLGNPAGIFMPQSIPPSSMNSYGNPYAAQTYGASNYGAPAGFSGGMPNFFG